MERSFVMLTFDLEEFDIPEEFGQKVSAEEQMQVTLSGMERVLSVLNAHGIPATFFTTAHFARQNPLLVRSLAKKHEIASHAFYHSPAHCFEEKDIPDSKQVLEEIIDSKISGFRMPRLATFDRSRLADAGFRYDSSLNPTWLPGRYNLLNESAVPFKTDGLIELPCSVAPLVRIPLFWLSFKNFPQPLYLWLCRFTLRKRGNLMLYFHPWEFADLSGYRLPCYIKSNGGERLARRLDALIRSLAARDVEFVTSNKFCDLWEHDRWKMEAMR